MNIVVTGAAGFLGRRLILSLLERGETIGPDGSRTPIETIRALDKSSTDIQDSHLETMVGDLQDAAILSQLIDNETVSIYHLAAMVSSQAELEFELGYQINFDATRALLDHIRSIGNARLKFVTASSLAVYGGQLPPVVTDSTVVAPQSSYGTAKAMIDLLVADYSRRGFVDGRSLRLPTVVVRPGKPNRAASGFASGIIREPLNGQEAICPVDPSTLLWIASPTSVIANLIHGHDLPADKFANGRIINLPGLSITVHEMIDSLREIAGDDAVRKILMQPDHAVQQVVNSWPGRFETAYASSLGFVSPTDFRGIVRQYLDDRSK